jgi:transcriptional regulator with XRE-family HTH domain
VDELRSAIKARLALLLGKRSQAVFSKAAGVAQSTVSDWLNEGLDALPPADKLAKICEADGISADWVLGTVTAVPEGFVILSDDDLRKAETAKGRAALSLLRKMQFVRDKRLRIMSRADYNAIAARKALEGPHEDR